MATIKVKRAYDPGERTDGFRILVDRLWPRGIKKEDLHVDVWLKEIAPSAALRKWFNHDVDKWKDFENRYKTELLHSHVVEQVLGLMKKHKTLTLVYSAKDEQHNQAIIIKEFLESTDKKSRNFREFRNRLIFMFLYVLKGI